MRSKILPSVTAQSSGKRKKTVCPLELSYKNAEAHYFALLFISAGLLSIFHVAYQSHKGADCSAYSWKPCKATIVYTYSTAYYWDNHRS